MKQLHGETHDMVGRLTTFTIKSLMFERCDLSTLTNQDWSKQSPVGQAIKLLGVGVGVWGLRVCSTGKFYIPHLMHEIFYRATFRYEDSVTQIPVQVTMDIAHSCNSNCNVSNNVIAWSTITQKKGSISSRLASPHGPFVRQG